MSESAVSVISKPSDPSMWYQQTCFTTLVLINLAVEETEGSGHLPENSYVIAFTNIFMWLFSP